MVIGPSVKKGTRFFLLLLSGCASVFPDYHARLMNRCASLHSTSTLPHKKGNLQKALAFFFYGPRPPDYSLYLKLLQLCIDANAKRQGHLIHAHLIGSGFPSNVHLSTKLVIFYSKMGDMINARKVSDKMLERSVVSWTALISGYSQNGKLVEALRVFAQMHKDGVKFNQYTYGSALRACTGLVCLDRGKQIQGRAQKGRFVENLFVQSALVDLYSKCRKINDAFSVFNSMMERDLVSWNAIIGGFAIHGFQDDTFLMFRLMLREGFLPDCFTFGSVLRASTGGGGLMEVGLIHRNGYGNEAVSLYKKMEDQGLKPNDVTLLSLLSACSHNGLTGEGWNYFNKVVSNYNISPTVEHYSCLIDLFARGGYLEEAYNVICNMNIKPNAALWGTILGSCYIHGDMSLGEVAAKHLMKIEPENSANYVVIAGMYATGGLWDSSMKIWKSMEQRSLLKNPGCSYFESTSKRVALLSTG